MKKVIIKPNTQVTHLQLLDDVPECEYCIQSEAEVTVVVYATGKKDVEGKTHVRLQGKGSRANIIGVFVSKNDRKFFLHTLQHHEAPETTSNLLVKTVLKDMATFSYDGAIRVEKEGQKTDAYQRNENLILSEFAHANSKPSLEILADDVRCTHGATIGTIDNEQLFYLATRGVGPEKSKQIITNGFLDHSLMSIKDESKRELVENLIRSEL